MPPPPPADRLIAALKGLDLTRADGRAGIRSLLAELDHRAPGALARRPAAGPHRQGPS